MKLKRLFAAALAVLAFSQISSAQVVTFKATITWADNSTNEDGFKIEKSSSATGTFTQVGSVGANVLSFVDTGLAPGTAVCYRIFAFNVAGNSAPSTVACANAPAPPAAPGTVQVIITLAP